MPRSSYVAAFFAIVALLCVFPRGAYCAAGLENFTSLDLGTFGSNAQSLMSTSVRSDAASAFGAFVRIRRGFTLAKRFFFEPSYGLVLPWRSGVDGTAMIFTSQLGLDFGIPLFSFLKWRVGPGVLWFLYVTRGSEVPLNNGDGTSTFYIPSRPMNVFLLTVDVGLEARFSSRISLGIDVYVIDVASSARRRFNGALTLGVVL